MRSWKLRAALIALTAGAVLFGSPGESYAILHWLCPSNWGSPPPTFGAARVPYAAASCGSCLPQTSYVPQTTYSPASGCTTCYSVTTYRPFWSWLTCRPRYSTTVYCRPYTAYRPAYTTYYASCTTPLCPTTACDPCGGSGLAAGASSCLGGGCAAATTTAPSYYEGSPSSGSGGESPSTFKSENGNSSSTRLKAVPDPTASPTSADGPHLVRPAPQVTARPVFTASYTRPVRKAESPLRTPLRQLDVSGWRASSD